MDAQACLSRMAAALEKRGWVGIEMGEENGRMVVKRVVPRGPPCLYSAPWCVLNRAASVGGSEGAVPGQRVGVPPR